MFNPKQDVITETFFNGLNGTKVIVKGLFSDNNLRKFELRSNIRHYISLCAELLTLYGTIFHDIEFRFFSLDEQGKATKIFSKPKFDFPLDNFENLFGAKISKNLHHFFIEEEGLTIGGYIANPFKEIEIIAKDQIFVAVNRRPIKKIPLISKTIRSILESKTVKRSFFIILFIGCPLSDVEVNLEKSKMITCFRNESKIIELLKQALEKLFDELYGTSFKVFTQNAPQPVEFSSQTLSDAIKPQVEPEAKSLSSINKKVAPKDVIIGLENQTLTKGQLSQLSVIGQFNRGFIICRLRDDFSTLYVIDQHASDEKATYEGLLSVYSLSKQRLAVPFKLSLSAFEKYVVEKNIQIFDKFGFELKISEEHNFVELETFPQFKDLTLGKDEFNELLELMKSEQPVDTFLFKKLKTEFASNACRYSIMIGQHLSGDQMKSIVSNLSFLKSPFNCPHGRPTIFQATLNLLSQSRKDQIKDFLFN